MLDYAAYSTIAVAWIIGTIALWLIIFPVGAGTVINKIEMPNTVRAGETVVALVDYCKVHSGKATSTYALRTSDQTFYFDPVFSNRPTGCDKVGFEIDIPLSAPPGPATYELDILREYNILNSEVISGKSNVFTILPAEQ